MPDNPIDIHCPSCQQVIIPAERMILLWNFKKDERHADDLVIPKVGNIVLLNADFVCPTCGRIIYFRLSEQKLNRIIRSIKHV